MADTSTDAERLDKHREGLDTTLSDIHSKLAEMESDKAESRAASILAGLGFSEERQHFPTKTFSGGWRMRLALARALFCEPDLLLLDGKIFVVSPPCWTENWLTWLSPRTIEHVGCSIHYVLIELPSELPEYSTRGLSRSSISERGSNRHHPSAFGKIGLLQGS